MNDIYDKDYGFSDDASLEEIKIFIARRVKTYNDAIIKANEAEMRLSKLQDVVTEEREVLSRLWLAKGHWLTKDIKVKERV